MTLLVIPAHRGVRCPQSYPGPICIAKAAYKRDCGDPADLAELSVDHGEAIDDRRIFKALSDEDASQQAMPSWPTCATTTFRHERGRRPTPWSCGSPTPRRITGEAENLGQDPVEPTDWEYGERQYTADDLPGHR